MSKQVYLMHYGVLGQKWGVRRYQNEDGTLTSAGKKRYNNDSDQVAMKTAVKYEALADLNDKKSKAQQALGKNPRNFNNSIERKQYLESMQKAQKAFADANSVVNDMVKKYKDVKIDILTEKETGEQYVQSILETKLGDKYISEFYLGTHVIK